MDNIFKRDYQILVKFDIHGIPYWELTKKGNKIIATKEEYELVSQAFGHIKKLIDTNIEKLPNTEVPVKKN